jgi:hypothetical protein
MMNGPCGGTNHGECEVSTPQNKVPCIWAMIVKRMEKLGTLGALDEIIEPKDWSTARDGGPRRRVREDLKVKADATETA